MTIKFLILAIIIFVKGVFSASETAFTYLNKAKFNQMSKHAKKKSQRKILKIKQLLDHKLRILGITEVGITVVELFASAFAAETFVGQMMEKLENLGLNTTIGYIISIVVITIILSYITLVFGELIPKRYARNNPEKVAYRTVNALTIFAKVNYIFEKIYFR